MIHNTKAIVIRKEDLRDFDRLLTLYTSDFGKIKVIARGVRKPKAKLAAVTELFVVSELRLFLREASGIGKLTGGVILDSNSLIRYNIHSFYEASYMAEALDAMTPDRQPNSGKYLLLKEKLALLNRGATFQCEDFVRHLLVLTGFGYVSGVSAEKLLAEHLRVPLKARMPVEKGSKW
jgi:DNA repair protein RecO (recombination protein O)